MNHTQTRALTLALTLVLAGLTLLGGCATPDKDLGPDFQALMQGSFHGEGIASVARLKQDPSQQACSSIQPPADGRYLGDWKLGEKLAQDGRGLTWTDKSAEASANGAGCYNCHQLSEAEVSYGTIGPSLRHYARNHGAANLADAKGQAAVRYTWGKLHNSWAALPCSNMPRFGHNGMLNPEQMRHLMALLLDPASPVNAP